MSDSRRPVWSKAISQSSEHESTDSGPTSKTIQDFLAGQDAVWDTILLPYDIRASRAHARGLIEAGILTAQEFDAIDGALSVLTEQCVRGDVCVSAADEDCHSVIEHHLVRVLGDTGKKIHTGRSRNDQVLAALRLYLSTELAAITEHVYAMIEGLCKLADRTKCQFLPGYTHFQRAMPSTVALWALGFGELLCSDLQSLVDARDHIRSSPLGSAAGYGIPFFDLPRDSIARELDFNSFQFHATSVQLSRGKFELNAVHALVQMAMTINRLASDLVLFSSAEFSFVTMPDALTTGSSIMPQKKNPDVLELARASVHRIVAEMNVLLSVPANLPSGYHRDLQLTKEATMRAVERAGELARVMVDVIPSISFNEIALENARSDDLFATACAYKQVAKGAPFRDAYKRAASNPTAWASLAGESLADLYAMGGQPGTSDPDYVRAIANRTMSRQ